MPLPFLALIGGAIKAGSAIVKKIKESKAAKVARSLKTPKPVDDNALSPQLYGGQLPEVTVTASRLPQKLPPWVLPVGLGLAGIVVLKSVLQ